MDDFREADSGETQDDGTVVAVHLVSLVLLIYLCWRCCCRRAPQEPPRPAPGTTADNPIQVSVDNLQPKKRLLTSYILWLVCGPWVSAHQFYLGRVVHGLLCIWTCNFFCFGWLLDGVLLPFYVARWNARYASPAAPYDNSVWRLIRLPLVFFAVVAMLVVVLISLPSWLQRLGIVDLDRMAAQTEANPYDTLGIKRGADISEAKAAYRKESLRWHPDRNIGCGRPCELKMAEISKAFDAIKKRIAPTEDRTYWNVLEEVGADWVNVISVFATEESKDKDTSGEAQAKSDL